jgi:hypothetical protein
VRDGARVKKRYHGFTSVTLVERRPQSLACGDPCGALGIDPAAKPGSGAMMPLKVRCDPQLPNKMMQREHRDEASRVLPATFLNEAIRHPSWLSPRLHECTETRSRTPRQTQPRRLSRELRSRAGASAPGQPVDRTRRELAPSAARTMSTGLQLEEHRHTVRRVGQLDCGHPRPCRRRSAGEQWTEWRSAVRPSSRFRPA